MDNELDELLDSALVDFDKNKEENSIKINNDNAICTETLKNKKSESNVTIEKTNINVEENFLSASSNVKNEIKTSIDDDMKLFEEIFNDEQSKETFKHFKDALNMFKNDDTNMLKEFEKIIETMSTVSTSSAGNIQQNLGLYEDDIDDDDDREQAKIKEKLSSQAQAQAQKPLDKILEDINKQSEKLLKNDQNMFNEEFLLSQLNLNDADLENDDDPASSLLMQPLISMLFSKDILYPSLKMMLDNYNKFLDEKKDKINNEEYEKYLNQKECIIQMCNIYENSKDNESQEEKSNKLKQILELLEKCGNPPQELVPEMSPFANMSGNLMKDSCPIS